MTTQSPPAASDPVVWSPARRRVVVALVALGLAVYASYIGAICDDAFILLRYSRNLLEHGSPVYNLGERVEGYTSPLWMLAGAVILGFGVEGRMALGMMGVAGGAALIAATWRLWQRIAPDKPIHGVLAIALVASSTPIAAWTSSGLETPLFTALLVFAVAELVALAAEPTRRSAHLAAAAVALATLTRPEGVLLLAIGVAWLLWQRAPRALIARFAIVALAPMFLFLAWRLAYYGTPLPNTFTAKLAAPLRSRVDFGLRYAWFTVTEMGFGLTAVLGASLVMPSRVAAVKLVRLVVVPWIAMVIFVGGDFLDLFRFFVPILPLLYVTLVVAAVEVGARLKATTRSWMLAAALSAPAWFMLQNTLRARAMQVEEPVRAELRIEPLGWTKHHARDWSDTGRFIAANARPGDTMADGAAGAAPYYAEIPNIDVFGLTDVEVARHGTPNGNRPGHQRFATLDYLKSRHPTFIMFDKCALPASWPRWDWNESGYVCVAASATSSFGGHLRLVFLMDRARAEELAANHVVRLPEPK